MNDGAHEFSLLIMDVGHRFFYIGGVERADAALPDWPTDIAAAFELVAIAQAEPYEQAFYLEHTPAISARWVAQLGGYVRPANTAARAIALAWLAWKGAAP